jgi:hypothetical protein
MRLSRGRCAKDATCQLLAARFKKTVLRAAAIP